MHRTKTTAALLATVAVTTLSGCVSVGDGPQPTATPRVSSAPPRAPHADSARPPRLVQPPAREALRLVGPAPRPTAPPYRPPAPAPPTTRSAPARTAPTLLTTAPGGDPYHHGCVRPRARVRGLGAR
ncbi:hypothetical protein [Streptomyces uncialis]|uniref:hypothetical protein n=1 Tax=Streptomyces uncialis TaxID=1048205 RepID=UPI002B1D8CA7|nr:hypothetical protein [Streptomyces uncialis]